MAFTLAGAPYPNRALAFCGAMALQSFLCSRKVRAAGGLRPNLYLLALAGSGVGKTYPRKVNSYILGQIGLGQAVSSQLASAQGLEDQMFVNRKMLYQPDDVDQLGERGTLPVMLAQLYSEADETHAMRTRANSRNRHNDTRGEIDQPGLVIFGTATPERFLAARPALLANGLFSRAIVLEATARGNRQAVCDVSEVPPTVIDTAAWWRDIDVRRRAQREEHPAPMVVPYVDDAEELLHALAAEADRHDDGATAPLWARAAENATRLALVYACSRDHRAPVIDHVAADWAVRLVGHLIRRRDSLAAAHVADSALQATCAKLVARLRRAKAKTMKRQELMRATHLKATDFDLAITTLIERGVIVEGLYTTRTKPAVVYRFEPTQ